MKLWMKVVAVLLLLIFCLYGCGPRPDDIDDVPSDSKQDSNENGNDQEQIAAPLVLSKDQQAEYRVVCRGELLENNQSMQSVLTLTDSLTQKTGAKFSFVADTAGAVQDREILVGSVARREESVAGMNTITAPDGTGYRISVEGSRILISCENPHLLGFAFRALVDGIVQAEDGSYVLPADFTACMDVPTYSEEIKPVVCYTGEGNYTASYGATNYMVYRDYLTALTELGFTEHDSNRIGRNYFATYIKNTATEKTAVHVMFYERLFKFEMTYGPLDEYLPSKEAPSVPTKDAVTPTITQIARNGSLQGAPGMSAILQLADASFVIFDGGPYDIQDEMDLYNFIRQRTPAGQKPVIAAWFITHAHGDHMGLALNFLRNYRNDVELRLGAFNFPDFDSITIQNENAANMKNMADSFQSLVLSYPDAECWVMHTGQSLKLPGCVIDVLYTPEDASSTIFAWGNHTCTAVRVTLNDTTFTVLGDAERSLCQQMADAYGSSIQSDILSLSHHGFNGACLDLYKCIDPDICFWPVDGARFNNDPRCTGAQGGYDFNAWLRNNKIKVRQHYTADETVTIPC